LWRRIIAKKREEEKKKKRKKKKKRREKGEGKIKERRKLFPLTLVLNNRAGAGRLIIGLHREY
jgi:hypothetical protein